jgi:hypothetical protein
MVENIRQFLNNKTKRSKSPSHPEPIILRWMNSPHRNHFLAVIDKLVGDIIERGGTKKVERWLLSDDKNFNSITAERYLINYLRKKNKNLVDNLGATGIDAHFELGESSIGLEVTTLNGFVAEWIFIERLTQYLDERGFLHDKSVEIDYSFKRISQATQGGTIYSYIAKAGQAIILNDSRALSNLKVSICIDERVRPGSISFDVSDGEDFPWFRYITEDLVSKLRQKGKANQLRRFSKNLVFVGINHLSPINWAFPSIFEELGNGGSRFCSQIQNLGDYWSSQLGVLTNVIGVCYFFYSLDCETPFYPMRVLWRNGAETTEINGLK